MRPLTSAVNLTPSSRACGSPTSTVAGTVELFHRLAVTAGAGAVVNDELASATRALPARSLTPLAPLLTRIV